MLRGLPVPVVRTRRLCWRVLAQRRAKVSAAVVLSLKLEERALYLTDWLAARAKARAELLRGNQDWCQVH